MANHNLDSLIKKILKDCEDNARQVTDAAKAEASGIAQRYEAEAAKEKERILSGAEDEAEKAAGRLVLSKRLEARDSGLDAKRKAVDNVFDAALKKLNAMPRDAYWKFLCESLLEMNPESGEIIFPAGYGAADADNLNTFLKEKGRPGNLTLRKDGRSIDGGFVLVSGGVEYNYTFETLLSYRRYELEAEIIKILF